MSNSTGSADDEYANRSHLATPFFPKVIEQLCVRKSSRSATMCTFWRTSCMSWQTYISNASFIRSSSEERKSHFARQCWRGAFLFRGQSFGEQIPYYCVQRRTRFRLTNAELFAIFVKTYITFEGHSKNMIVRCNLFSKYRIELFIRFSAAVSLLPR